MGSFTDQLRAFTNKADRRVDQVVRGVVYRCGARLVITSPVASGRFRSNWYYGLNTPDTRTTTRTNVREVNEIDGMPLKAAGHNHFITNSLPYAIPLERGHSKQAPNGMARLTVIAFPKIVAEAVAEAREAV